MPAMSAQLTAFVPAPARAAAVANPSRPSLLHRVILGIQEARMRQAEREVGRFVEANGSRMTDRMEREIERNFL